MCRVRQWRARENLNAPNASRKPKPGWAAETRVPQARTRPPARPRYEQLARLVLNTPVPVDLFKDGFSLLEPALGLHLLVLWSGIRVKGLPVCRPNRLDHKVRAALVQSHAAKQGRPTLKAKTRLLFKCGNPLVGFAQFRCQTGSVLLKHGDPLTGLNKLRFKAGGRTNPPQSS